MCVSLPQAAAGSVVVGVACTLSSLKCLAVHYLACYLKWLSTSGSVALFILDTP